MRLDYTLYKSKTKQTFTIKYSFKKFWNKTLPVDIQEICLIYFILIIHLAISTGAIGTE